MTYILFFKALHVVGFISWFAGLFYLGRILVNHAESDQRPPVEQPILAREYVGAAQRVYSIITKPAMLITWAAGLLMLAFGWNSMAYFSTGTPGWMHLKLTMLLLLVAYQLYTHQRIMRPMALGERPFTTWQLRLWNEVPTFFLVSISFIAVFGKAGQLNYGYLLLGVAVFSGLVYRGAVAYRKKRA